MKPAEELLLRKIREHPKGRIARAYKLGKSETQREIIRKQSIIESLEADKVALRRQIPPAPSPKQGGTLSVKWVNGAHTTITLATTAPLDSLVREKGFLVIPTQGDDHRGEIINLANVLMLSQT